MRWLLAVLIVLVLTHMAISFLMWADIAIVNHNVGLIYELLPFGEDA